MNTVTVDLSKGIGTINPHVYGHFLEHIGGVVYDGVWVGRDSKIPNDGGIRLDLVESLRRIKPAVIRWPGGCFAEHYRWRDGVGPADTRPVRSSFWRPLDGKVESNQFGTHEFVRFCRMIGADPYFATGVAEIPATEVKEWVEYCNDQAGTTALAKEREANGSRDPFDVIFWGIGNENWGFGGNIAPDDYASAFRRYGTTVGGLNTKILPTFDGERSGTADDLDAKLIACGPSRDDYDWTRRFFEKWSDGTYGKFTRIYGFALHYYCGTAGTATEFSVDEWYTLVAKASFMAELIDRHRAIMDEYDPERNIKLIVDEWGSWHPVGSGPTKNAYQFEQQATMRDAIVAAVTLNIFNNRADVVAMSNIAQLTNCLQSLYLIHGEDFVETPNYHVFDLFQGHQGGTAVQTRVDCDQVHFKIGNEDRAMPSLSCSASSKRERVTLTLANVNMEQSAQVKIVVKDAPNATIVRQIHLRAADPHDHNVPSDPNRVIPREVEGDRQHGLDLTLCPASVVLLEIQTG